MSSKHKISIIYVFVEQAPGAQGIAQFYKTPVCLAPDSFPPTPCGNLPLIDFGLFPNSSVGQRREQTSFSCIIDQPCVSPLSIKQSFILPKNDYICIYSTLEDDRRIPRLGNESFIISTAFILFCAIPAFLEARQVDNVQKSRRHINPGSATYY